MIPTVCLIVAALVALLSLGSLLYFLKQQNQLLYRMAQELTTLALTKEIVGKMEVVPPTVAPGLLKGTAEVRNGVTPPPSFLSNSRPVEPRAAGSVSVREAR